MSYFERHIAPVSLKPISLAPLLLNSTKRTYSFRIGLAIWCHPTHAFFSSSGSRLLPMICSRSGRLKHFPFSPSGQYLPFPYSPSIEAAILVSSLRSFGSFGAGSVSESLSSFSFRFASGERSRFSYRRACSASSVVAAIRSSLLSLALPLPEIAHVPIVSRCPHPPPALQSVRRPPSVRSSSPRASPHSPAPAEPDHR